MGRTGVHTTQPDHSGQRLLSVFTQALFFDLFEAGANGNAQLGQRQDPRTRNGERKRKGGAPISRVGNLVVRLMTSVVAPGSDQGATVSTVVRVLRTRVE